MAYVFIHIHFGRKLPLSDKIVIVNKYLVIQSDSEESYNILVSKNLKNKIYFICIAKKHLQKWYFMIILYVARRD